MLTNRSGSANRISRRTLTVWLIAAIAVLPFGVATSSAIAARTGLKTTRVSGCKATNAIDCPTQCYAEYRECLADGGNPTLCQSEYSFCLAHCP